MDENGPSGEKSGPSTTAVEIVVAVIIFLFGALVVYDSVRLGHRWGDDGPQAGYFPFYIGVILCISTAVIVFQALAAKTRSHEVFVEYGQLKDILSVLIPAAIYVFGIQVIGIYVASAIYIALFMALLGKYSWINGVLTGVGVAAFFFAMFEVWFQIPLYKGWFNPLAFTGY
jgi:hypothetical protein